MCYGTFHAVFFSNSKTLLTCRQINLGALSFNHFRVRAGACDIMEIRTVESACLASSAVHDVLDTECRDE